MQGIQRQIDDCLSVRDGHLFVEDCDTVKLVAEFGSPLFVFSEQQLRSNIRKFHTCFSRHWPAGAVEVLPAIKANWIIALRKVLSEEGAGADIYSEGELHAALQGDVTPSMISVNGGGKSDALIERCIKLGTRLTVEDLDEPERISAIAARLGKKALVRLRVKPDFPALYQPTDFAQEKISIDLGIQVYKSGIPAQYLPELGRKVLSLPHIELTGLHFHGGRHHSSLWYWEVLMEGYAALIADLCQAWPGWKPREIDIGGGFATSRDPHNKIGLRQDVVKTWLIWPWLQTLRVLSPALRYRILNYALQLFGKNVPQTNAPTIEQYAQSAAGTLYQALRRRNVDLEGVVLQLEPGRSLFSNTGIHLTKVKKFKQQTSPIHWNWVLTDTTYFFLTGGTYEYQFNQYIFANRANDPQPVRADIVGHSCYADRILPQVSVPEVKEGDLLALLDMGAYQEVSASNFNALPRPASLLVSGSEAALIRRAETTDDLFRRDLTPARFASKS